MAAGCDLSSNNGRLTHKEEYSNRKRSIATRFAGLPKMGHVQSSATGSANCDEDWLTIP